MDTWKTIKTRKQFRETHLELQGQQHESVPNGEELSRLMNAAVVSRQFCHLLLTDPAQALAEGYSGEQFNLQAQDRALVLSIQADDLAEFATQLAEGHNNHND